MVTPTGVHVIPVADEGREALVRCENNGLEKSLSSCSNKQIGAYGEELAVAYLESCDYVLCERNWRSTFGEVDIIAEDQGTIVLVEVKTRIAQSEDDIILPELAVDYRKRNRYQKLALVYLSLNSHVETVRFDVVALKLTGENEARLRHYPAAYEWGE